MSYYDRLMKLYEDVSPSTFVDLVEQYERYCMEFYATHDEGSTPVCVLEFYENDYE